MLLPDDLVHCTRAHACGEGTSAIRRLVVRFGYGLCTGTCRASLPATGTPIRRCRLVSPIDLAKERCLPLVIVHAFSSPASPQLRPRRARIGSKVSVPVWKTNQLSPG